MTAAAFGALERRARGRFGHNEQRLEIDRRVPPRIVLATAGHADFARAALELLETLERALEAGLVADDAGIALHDRLEGRLDGVRVLAVTLERRERFARRGLDLPVRYLRCGAALRRRVLSRAPSEHQQVAERIAAKPVRAVHAAADFARGVEAGDGRFLRLGVDLHAAHDVVRRRADFHRILGDVDRG